MARVVAITGGIGSGKSVVSNILRVLGYGVYDCDSQAKRIVEASDDAIDRIVSYFGEDARSAGGVNWKYLSSVVFRHKEMIATLNGVIHPLVRQDVARWAEKAAGDIVFVETAILRESKMDAMVDGVWLVTAPEDVRVARVMARNNLPEEAVRVRIAAQKEYDGDGISLIVNDGIAPLLPRILQLLRD